LQPCANSGICMEKWNKSARKALAKSAKAAAKACGFPASSSCPIALNASTYVASAWYNDKASCHCNSNKTGWAGWDCRTDVDECASKDKPSGGCKGICVNRPGFKPNKHPKGFVCACNKTLGEVLSEDCFTATCHGHSRP